MLKNGEYDIGSVYNGPQEIIKIYNGTDIVFQKSNITDWTKIDKILPTLKVGDQLSAPTAYGFYQIVFEVVDNNNNQTENHISVDGYDHTVTLQTKNLISKDDKSTYLCQFNTSNNRSWLASSLRTWLNDGFLKAFLKDTTGASKTDDELIMANAFINSIQTLSVETYTSGGGKKVTSDKVWLPSLYEVGCGEKVPSTCWGNEGHVLDKFKDAPGTGEWDVRRKMSDGGENVYSHWLRSAYVSTDNFFESICSPTGSINAGLKVTMKTAGITPLITLAYNKT